MKKDSRKDKETLKKEVNIWSIATGLGTWFSAQDIVSATKHPDTFSILCLVITLGLTAVSAYKLNEAQKEYENNTRQR